MQTNFTTVNSSKANFDEIYASKDPRSYFSVLGSLDYMIPDIAAPIVRQLLAEHRCQAGKQRILDVGCSYGINAAVHRFPVTFATLRRRYAHHDVAAVSSSELMRLDRNYYASWPDIGMAKFVGLDVSAAAINYAVQVGLLEDGFVADLERSALSPQAAKSLEGVDVILSTGAVGYVTEKTFRAVLAATRRKPWIISFVLRLFPYDSLSALFAEHGLVTEKLASAMFVQRRFRDLAEFHRSLDTLSALGLQTDGFEADGLLRAELYVSRPAADVKAASLEEIVTVCSGRNRSIGPRYVRVPDAEYGVALEP